MLQDKAPQPASRAFSHERPEVQMPEWDTPHWAGYCWMNSRPHLKPHTALCLLSSGPQSCIAIASLEHCPLSIAVSVLPVGRG